VRSVPTVLPRDPRAMRPVLSLALLLCLLALAGCVGLQARGSAGLLGEGPPPGNPVFIAGNNEEAIWERTVDVVHNYFDIARENRIDGIIETKPKVGSSLFEPWHHETVGFYNRLESTLQSIRRRGFIHLTPGDGGYLISVEIYKELQDVPNSGVPGAGAATFQQNNPLQRDLSLVVGQRSPEGWIVTGRDVAAEQSILSDLHQEFLRPGAR
jgi:hypothetical protein